VRWASRVTGVIIFPFIAVFGLTWDLADRLIKDPLGEGTPFYWTKEILHVFFY
jgi:hypothetical protein